MLTDVVTKKHMKGRMRAKIRNRYNQAPHLTQDTNGKVTTSQLDIRNENQEVSPFQAGDYKASITDAQERIPKKQDIKSHLNVTGVQFFRLQI